MSVSGNRNSVEYSPKAPQLSVSNSFRTFNIDETSEKLSLVHFWDSEDAVSRIENKTLTQLAKDFADKIDYVGIYSGADRTLFETALLADGCNAENQFFLADSENYAREYADFSLASGNHTLLISKDGRILSINPSDEQLKSLLNK